MNDCISEIKKEYYKKMNECNLNYKKCNNNCNDDDNSCIYNCDLKYKCDELYKKDTDILIHINKLEKIIENINNKNVILKNIIDISDAISKNFTEDEKKNIKYKYFNKIDCKNTSKPCMVNSKFLLHLILELLNKKYSHYNLKKNYEFKKCHSLVGHVLDDDIYELPLDLKK